MKLRDRRRKLAKSGVRWVQCILGDYRHREMQRVWKTWEPTLPDGVRETGDGVYKATCRSCQRDYELGYDPQDFTEEGNYCGGSDRCLP